MSLLIPKQVNIANFKLRMFYYCLQFLFFSVAFLKFVATEQWAKPLSVGPYMAGELWVNPVNHTRLDEVWRERSQSQVCLDPQSSDFQWDPAGTWSYQNHSCYSVCDSSASAVDPTARGCIWPMDVHRRESQSQVFFVTQFEERPLQQDGSLSQEQRMAFVPLETAYSISFIYHFSVPQPSMWGEYATQTANQAAPRLTGSSEHDVLTVIQSADSGIARVVEPGLDPSIELGVEELLSLAGIPDFLDVPNADAGPNYLNGPGLDGAIGRITGLNIDLNIECLQRADRDVSLVGYGGEDWAGPVCYVRVERSPIKKWATAHAEVIRQNGQHVVRTLHGLRVSFVLGGRFSFFDFEYLVLQVTASIVFLFMPKQMIFFFVIHMLGHLSSVYRDALIEQFCVGKEIGRIAARMLSTSVTFVELEDEVRKGGGTKMDGIISKKRLNEQMREILHFRDETLQENEMRGLVNFCYNSLLSINSIINRSKLETTVSGMMDALDKRFFDGARTKRRDPEKEVNIDCFSMCCASSSTMEFDSFVRMFDSSRKKHFLERWFTPEYLENLSNFGSEASTQKAQRAPSRDITHCNGGDLNLRGTLEDARGQSHTDQLRARKASVEDAVLHHKDVAIQSNRMISEVQHGAISVRDRLALLERRLNADDQALLTRIEMLTGEVHRRMDTLERSCRRNLDEVAVLMASSGRDSDHDPYAKAIQLPVDEVAFSALGRRVDSLELLAADTAKRVRRAWSTARGSSSSSGDSPEQKRTNSRQDSLDRDRLNSIERRIAAIEAWPSVTPRPECGYG